MIYLPNFARRRARERPVKFVTVTEAFTPQVQVRALRDLNGWVNHKERVKWHLGIGQSGFMDEPHAREYAAKGYVEILNGQVRPVSEQEMEQYLSTVTVLNLGD